MSLTPEAINEFKEIYQRKFGVVLSDKDALELGTRLIVMMKAVYKPIPKPVEWREVEQTKPR